MAEGTIPINPEDLPTEAPTLEDSAVYNVVLKKFVINPRRSKEGTGVIFGKVTCEVSDGDFEGATLMSNYLPLPIGSDGTKRGDFLAQKNNAQFGRFCATFRIKGQMPAVDLNDASSVEAFNDWISQYYEASGKVTIRNQEFPAGSNRYQSGISDYIF